MCDRITISAVPMIIDLVLPHLMLASAAFDDLDLRYVSDFACNTLDGPCVIALRAGARPKGEKWQVARLGTMQIALAASRSYLARHPPPETPADLRDHVFTGPDHPDDRSPWGQWLSKHVENPRYVLRADGEGPQKHALRSGRCAGFLPLASLIWLHDLVELYPAQPEWHAPLWLIRRTDAPERVASFADMLADRLGRVLLSDADGPEQHRAPP